MNQNFLSRPRFVATAGLLLGATGLIVVACGSEDESPSVEAGDSSLTPDNTGTAGTGAGGSAGAAGASSGGSGNGEAPSTDIPVVSTNPEQPVGSENGGAGGAPVTPPTSELAPNCAPPEGAVPNLALELVADGLNEPIYVTAAPGDSTRLFVMEKAGRVRVILNGQLQEQPFVDVSEQVANVSERGLLGLAFHPAYATNGLFYLHFSSSGANGIATGTGVVAELTVNSADRSLADAASQRQVLLVAQPEPNHNGGEITFGPDGLLYLGFGDGGGGNDQHGPIGNGQSLETLLGKLLRIDPTGRAVNDAYSIPAGNLAEVTGQTALPEIWAYGLRNPWRFSFDACAGDLYLGDVGQNTIEEIDFLPATTSAGTNFGWRIMEGPNCRPGDTVCNAQTQVGLTLPVDSYGTDVGRSVTGGYVYRGSNVPGLRGTYIYADYVSARFFRFRIENGQAVDRQEITDQLGSEIEGIASFGTDNTGEMYIAAFGPGAVYRITSAP
jgi:glucose/arabinose dehydrogenase